MGIPGLSQILSSALPLLSPEEEIALGKQRMESEEAILALARGNGNAPGNKKHFRMVEFLKKIEGQGNPGLQAQLARESAAYLEARSALITRNFRLIVAQLGPYMRRGQAQIALDLFQDGTLGLMRAAEQWDWRKGWRFSTYATYWIWQHIERGCFRQSLPIQLPLHLALAFRKVHQAKDRLERGENVKATPEEIARISGIRLEIVKAIIDVGGVLSLGNVVWKDSKGGDELLLEDSVRIPHEEGTPEVAILETDAQEHLERALNQFLTPQQARVIFLRYIKEMTMIEVGREIGGKSRQRVDQIEKEALQKLRRSRKFKQLVVGG